MSRMQKAVEWLCKGYHLATSADYITDWSPNNIKTIIISGKYMAVEYFIPYNMERFEMWEIEDVELDLKALEFDKPVPGILKSLCSNKIFANLEEIIITSFEYNNSLYKIDNNIDDLVIGTDIYATFPRLRNIIHTDISFHELYNIMAQINMRDWVSYKEILIANKDKFNSCVIHVDDYATEFYKSIFLVGDNYKIDEDNGKLYNYLKDIEYNYTGNVTFDEVVNRTEVLKQFFTTIPCTELNIRTATPLKNLSIPLEFIRSDLFNANMSAMRVRSFLTESILNSLEVMLKLENIKQIRITSGSQLVLNEQYIVNPVMSYDLFMALPDNLFVTILNMDKTTFSQQAMLHFKRIPNMDSDIGVFEEWLITKKLMWGKVFNFKDIGYFPNIQRIEVNNPYRICGMCSEISLKSFEWSELYDTIPSLKKDGLYLNGIHINSGTEHIFKDRESALNRTLENILQYANDNKYYLPQLYHIEDNTATSKALQKVMGKEKGSLLHSKLADFGAKVTSLYRKFDID